MGMTKKYWKGIDELKETPQFLASRDQEFPMQTSVEEFLGDENLAETSTARRDFLKFLGFSVAAATVAACEAPVVKAIPYVNKPENVTPGLATWYASTYYDGNSYASILVKTREGRPIFIKGNKDYGINRGATNPQIIASVLGLYDGERLHGPTKDGEVQSTYGEIDKDIIKKLKAAKKVVVMSNTVISPSIETSIGDLSVSLGGVRDEMTWAVTNPNFEHIQYDAVSYAGMRAANKKSFGLTVDGMPESDGIIPDYDFSKAKTIVSIGADFLSTWLLATQFAPQYAMRRNPDGEWMSKHYQFESVLSITGSNADVRAMIKPSEQASVLAYILGKMGVSVNGAPKLENAAAKKAADAAVKSLNGSKGESLVVCGSNDMAVQILVNKLNDRLGAYEKTINVNNRINLFRSQDAAASRFVKSVIAGKEKDTAVVFINTNPAYSLPNGAEFMEKVKGMKLSVAVSLYADETASKCTYVCPDHHALEGWNDMGATTVHYALAQPTIRPLWNTASVIESLQVWSGNAKRGGKDSKVAFEYIKGLWEVWGFPTHPEYTDFQTYWNTQVHNSTENVAPAPVSAPAFDSAALNGLKFAKGGDLEVVLYQKAAIGTGAHASNPWLQEMPDPLSKVTWDNYITMNPVEMEGKYATTFDQEHGLNMATVTVGGKSLTLPVYPMPGQAPKTVGIALGYGRGAGFEKIGKSAYQTAQYGGHITDGNGNPMPIGVNAFGLVGVANGTMAYDLSGSIQKTEGMYPIAATQLNQTVMGRHSIVRETTADIYKNRDKEAYNPAHTLQKLDEHGNHVERPVSEFTLWDEHPVEKIGHRWGMTIDLSSCIGCGSCLIACQSENNVPVVGKDEVRRGREMHWLRLDRYFASEQEAAVGQRKDALTFDFGLAEKPAENPQVVHMPMMCHHCNHAPCETVCPVAATTHSNEGLNMMAYNRCIGTRYCANNCPYKVRRFNWFNYPSYKAQREINPAQDDLGRMVLNPDVTVRTRGVMEKCSFCVQRIQEGKLTAKKEARPVVDGDVTTACSDACPTSAITVGDWNDVKSMVRKSADDNRAYQALEEIGVKPNVWFKVKVRNEDNALLNGLQAASHHEEAEAGQNNHH